MARVKDFWEYLGLERPEALRKLRLVRFGRLELEAVVSEGQRAYFDEAQRVSAMAGLVLPRFREVMSSVLLAGHEDRLVGEQVEVFHGLVRGHGEWTDDVFYREGSALYHATRVRGLLWNERAFRYESAWMTAEEVKRYDVGWMKEGEWVRLWEVGERCPQLLVDFYGRRYAELPDFVKRHGRFSLPVEGRVVPLSWGVKYSFDICALAGQRSFRGSRSYVGRLAEVYRGPWV